MKKTAIALIAILAASPVAFADTVSSNAGKVTKTVSGGSAGSGGAAASSGVLSATTMGFTSFFVAGVVISASNSDSDSTTSVTATN